MVLNQKLRSLAAWNLGTFRQFVPHREQNPRLLHRPYGWVYAGKLQLFVVGIVRECVVWVEQRIVCRGS
jgi:hypothetical protein